ncbi:glycosyltransferase [Algibacter lectus]|uniref:Glycosyltransferase n=1 Tax=Algibacter lectus TaxID=221126 RepID=A0A090WQH6_9FLAO|nr:glycosyltransferase [Algibacter lectus]GAL77634.1 glycosyltransferase [Algibacter lectus]
MILDNIEEHLLISIIIPVFNDELFIQRSVQSALDQTYSNLEIIIINDGSTDNSGKVCDDLQKKDSRIKVIHQKNGGLSVARNSGLEIYKGDYVAFLDSDDWFLPNMLKDMLSCALENNLKLVECGIIKSTKLNTLSSTTRSDVVIEDRTSAYERIIEKSLYSVWRRLYKKELLQNIKFIPSKIYEDIPFTMEILEKIDKIGYISIPNYVYYVENNSLIRSGLTLKKLNSIDSFTSIKKYYKHFNNKTKKNASQFILRVLRNNYNDIYLHTTLDPNYEFRKPIKNEIIDLMKTENINSFKYRVIKMLPIRLYGLFFKSITSLRKSN